MTRAVSTGTVPMAAVTRAELEADAFFQDPYPIYARLRARGGPYDLTHAMNVSSSGIRLFSRHAEALQVFRATESFSKEVRRIRPPGAGSPFDLHMLHRDGADHLRLRRLVAEHFASRSIQALQPVIDESAAALLDTLHGRDRFDLVAEFADPLPVAVVARVVGLPVQALGSLRRWSLDLCDGFDSLTCTPEILQRQRRALEEFLAFTRSAIAEARGRGGSGDTLLDALVRLADAPAAEGDTAWLDSDELLAMVGFLLFAGHETSVMLIGNALVTLLHHPEAWQALRADPAGLPRALEEVLRYESPEQRTSFRQVLQPVTIGDTPLQPGQQVGVIIGSANRDEHAFADAHRFDITRDPNPHLAFGFGLHICLGRQMARIEAAGALSALMQRLPRLALADAQPDWRRNSFFRSLASLRVHRSVA